MIIILNTNYFFTIVNVYKYNGKTHKKKTQKNKKQNE